MTYRYSDIDNNNIKWFTKDESKATLLSIEMLIGEIRGLKDVKIEFKYPITAIAGRNGSGKTTVLALVACAYHSKGDFKLPHRRYAYYTFSDFFIQTSGEVPPEGIRIGYGFLFNRWRKTPQYPDGRGIGYQVRKKRRGGKWNNYDSRISRAVVYLGIDRVVPPAEKSTSKSYKRSFSGTTKAGYESEVQEIVGRILEKDYKDFHFRIYKQYRLPIVTVDGREYSGFNMGAGENALFELFSILSACDESMLLVIDEIELGLHAEAQERLIKELKNICEKRHVQIICTTHSSTILECLPPKGRIFLDKIGDKIQVLPGISPAFAAGKLSGKRNAELDIYVEDEVAEDIVNSVLANNIKDRVNVSPIGSAAAIIRQLAARYKDQDVKEACAIFDGDQRTKEKSLVKSFLNNLESSGSTEEEDWVKERLTFLPGDTWPEKWILSNIDEADIQAMAEDYRVSKAELKDFVKAALRSGKHNEFYTLANKLNSQVEIVRDFFSKRAIRNSPTDEQRIQSFVENLLDG